MSGTIFKQINFDLGTLMNNISLGMLGLPDIQRPFIWKNVKVRDLFDSMYKGYPVGYLLFWSNGEVDGHKAIGTDGKQTHPSTVIVDGQQRLTGLYAVVKGQPVVRNDFKSERIRIAFNPLEGTFEVASAATERDPYFMPDITQIWQPQPGLFEVVGEYIQRLQDARGDEVTPTEKTAIQNSFVRLQGLTNYPFTALDLVADIDDEAVADVFVRVNSQGAQLNQSDFILTLMSVFWDEGRHALEQFSRDARTPDRNGPTPANPYIEPEPHELLRVSIAHGFRRARLATVYNILRGKDLETEEFSQGQREKQFDRLQAAQADVLNLQNWHDFMTCIHKAGYRSARMVSSKNTLLYSYALYLIGRKQFGMPTREIQETIAKWFFMASVTSRYTSSPESRMESDLAMLRDCSTKDDFREQLERVCDVELTNDFFALALPERLATSAARSPALFAYEAALVLLDAPVLYSDLKVADVLSPGFGTGVRTVERHHLFPRGFLATREITETQQINRIANFAYVEWADNAGISDADPAEYVPKYEARFSPPDLVRMHEAHALPTGWQNMEYAEFLPRRRELIAKVVEKAWRLLSSGRPAVTPPAETDLALLLEDGESDVVEFKSTLRVNLHTQERDTRIENVVLKTMAGFLNKDGGTLVIGVADDGSPVGLDADSFVSEDAMYLHLTNIVKQRMGLTTSVYIHATFDDWEDERVMIVRCDRSRSPVYVNADGQQHFYVRTGPATTSLEISDATEYIKNHFGR